MCTILLVQMSPRFTALSSRSSSCAHVADGRVNIVTWFALIQCASLRIATATLGHTDWMNPSTASSARSPSCKEPQGVSVSSQLAPAQMDEVVLYRALDQVHGNVALEVDER